MQVIQIINCVSGVTTRHFDGLNRVPSGLPHRQGVKVILEHLVAICSIGDKDVSVYVSGSIHSEIDGSVVCE